MSPNHFTVNSRELNACLPLQDELVLASDKNYVFDLSYLACLDVIGDRSAEFLQGQLTCDVREVKPTHMQQGALCNLKGRILALMDVIDWRGMHLILPQDLIADTQASLNKTALFSQVKLQVSNEYQLFGFQLNSLNDKIPFDAKLPLAKHDVVHGDDYCCYGLGDNLYVFVVGAGPRLRGDDMELNQRGSLAWHALQLRAGQVGIYPESRGLFLPHRLGLQHSGYLSFNKGCYKGQEIIARTHYRAKLKHELKLFTIETSEALKSGLRLFNAEGNVEIGELVDFCPMGAGRYLIAVSAVFEHSERVLIEGHEVPSILREALHLLQKRKLEACYTRL